jgi:hypothetical protein
VPSASTAKANADAALLVVPPCEIPDPVDVQLEPPKLAPLLQL